MLTNAIPVLLTISLLPGLCMLLALNLGLRYGVGRTLWMMAGELTAVTLIALLVLLGISAVVFSNPSAYMAIKLFGSGYLAYIGVCVMLSGGLQIEDGLSGPKTASPAALAKLGFMVAASNPKPWILYTALLPALIQQDRPMLPQALQLIALLIVIELASLVLYASGGHGLRRILTSREAVRILNFLLGAMIIASALSLLISD